jgi:hypothetical protein
MPSPPDRLPGILEVIPSTPLPPLNLTCSMGFTNDVVDLWWSSPGEISSNTKFNIVGVNVYRSFDSEFGPYHRINANPIQSNYYRDSNKIQVILREDVTNKFIARGNTDPNGRWIFRTDYTPIVLQPSLGTECSDMNVFVTIDGEPALVKSIVSQTGEIELDRNPQFNVINQRQLEPVLPTENSVVLASYRYRKQGVQTNLYQRIFYRVSTVILAEDGSLVETPLKSASTTNTNEIEKLDWIWQEAIRRNKFILQQGGERVKVFIRKYLGPQCGCYSFTNKQPASDCLVCYATGVIGGYDGPYDLLVAPDDSEKNIAQSNRGRSLTHAYETWTGPQPLLSQRDFIVKLNGDRYGIGPVRMPSNRGMQLQQHFSISHLDQGDIRYQVPVLDTSTLVVPQTRYITNGEGRATPMTSEREAIPDEREIRGKTVVYENTYRR